MSVTPLPGTSCQRGSRPVRHPKITGRTSQQCNIMEIITQSGTSVLQMVYKAIKEWRNINPSMARYRVLTGSGRHMRGYGLERLHSTGSGWATDPSTLLLLVLAKVEVGSSPKSGHNHKAREYINYALSKNCHLLQTIRQSCNRIYIEHKILQHGKVYSRYMT